MSDDSNWTIESMVDHLHSRLPSADDIKLIDTTGDGIKYIIRIDLEILEKLGNYGGFDNKIDEFISYTKKYLELESANMDLRMKITELKKEIKDMTSYKAYYELTLKMKHINDGKKEYQ